VKIYDLKAKKESVKEVLKAKYENVIKYLETRKAEL